MTEFVDGGVFDPRPPSGVEQAWTPHLLELRRNFFKRLPDGLAACRAVLRDINFNRATAVDSNGRRRIISPGEFLDSLAIGWDRYPLPEIRSQGEEGRRLEKEAQDQMMKEFVAWCTTDKMAYVAEALESQPDLHFYLVPTPNVVVPYENLAPLRGRLPSASHVPVLPDGIHDVFNRSTYTARQLCGTVPENGNTFAFRLMPDLETPGMEGTVEEQRMMLAKLQRTHPFLRVPSILDAYSYWATLRSQANPVQLKSDQREGITGIRHFDLPEQELDNGYVVGPYTVIDKTFGKILHIRRVNDRLGARLEIA